MCHFESLDLLIASMIAEAGADEMGMEQAMATARKKPGSPTMTKMSYGITADKVCHGGARQATCETLITCFRRSQELARAVALLR